MVWIAFFAFTMHSFYLGHFHDVDSRLSFFYEEYQFDGFSSSVFQTNEQDVSWGGILPYGTEGTQSDMCSLFFSPIEHHLGSSPLLSQVTPVSWYLVREVRYVWKLINPCDISFFSIPLFLRIQELLI